MAFTRASRSPRRFFLLLLLLLLGAPLVVHGGPQPALECPDPYEPNDACAEASVITPPFELQSYVCSEADVDWYSFWADAGDEILINLSSLPADYDLGLFVPENCLNPVQRSANGGVTPEVIPYTAPSGAYYLVQVWGYGTEYGNYDAEAPYLLTISVTAPTPTPTPTTQVCGDQAYEPNESYAAAHAMDPDYPLDGYICYAGDEDWFDFFVTYGQQVTVNLTNLPANYDLALYGHEQAWVERSSLAGTSSEQVSAPAQEMGWCAVQVYGVMGAYSAPQAYHLDVEVTGTQCQDIWENNDQQINAGFLTLPASISAYMCTPTDNDWFSFDVTAGDTIWVEMTNLPLDYDVKLYDPDMGQVGAGENHGSVNERIEHTALKTGRYYVVIWGQMAVYDPAQSYDLDIWLGQPSQTATATPTTTLVPETATPTPTTTVYPSPTATPTPTTTVYPSATATVTVLASSTVTRTATQGPSPTPTRTPTMTVTATWTLDKTPTATATLTPGGYAVRLPLVLRP